MVLGCGNMEPGMIDGIPRSVYCEFFIGKSFLGRVNGIKAIIQGTQERAKTGNFGYTPIGHFSSIYESWWRKLPDSDYLKSTYAFKTFLVKYGIYSFSV